MGREVGIPQVPCLTAGLPTPDSVAAQKEHGPQGKERRFQPGKERKEDLDLRHVTWRVCSSCGRNVIKRYLQSISALSALHLEVNCQIWQNRFGS